MDRKGERERMLHQRGTQSRVLIEGPPDSGVSDFAAWLVADYAQSRKLIQWDFEKAPGTEGIDVLRELAEALPQSLRFAAAYETVKAEFMNAPSVYASQSVGEGATAGRDQTIITEMRPPTLADHLRRNLYRLAKALFEDLKCALEAHQFVFALSGIRAGGEHPTPRGELLEVFLSSVWRLAETCPPDRLCVVLAVTVMNSDALRSVGPCLHCLLGPVELIESCDVIVERVAGLSAAEAMAVVQAVASPGAAGLTYTELQERIAFLTLNRLERSRGDSQH